MKPLHLKRLAAGAVAASLGLAGCGLDSGSESGGDVEAQAGSVDPEALAGVSVAVGSKEFDEQLLLGQLTIFMMDAAGAEVTDETNTAGSTATRERLLAGEIAVYWDYTGTGWITYLGNDQPIEGSQPMYEAVKKADLEENGLVWGPLAPFNNSYGMAVSEAFSQENDLTTLSDMKTYTDENPDSTVCLESEFASRPDGFPGLVKAYDMSIPPSSIEDIGTGVIYPQTAANDGTCDFGEVFTTDGRIVELGLLTLEDDQSFFPLYNGAPIVQKENPDGEAILEVLAPLAEVLTTEVMLDLNTQVSSEGLPPEEVAETFLTEEGFLQ